MAAINFDQPSEGRVSNVGFALNVVNTDGAGAAIGATGDLSTVSV